MCYCASENKEGVVYFMERILEDFPELELVFQDAGKALIAGCDAIGVAWRRCVFHIGKKAREEFGRIDKKFLDTLYGIAKLTSEALYDAAFAKMRINFPKCGRALDWIEERKESFANFVYMRRGFMSLYQATSNPAEQHYKFVRELRELPVISMMQAILQKYSSKYLNQLDEAQSVDKKLKKALHIQYSRLKLVPMAILVLEKSLELMKTKSVSFSSISHNGFSATVDLGGGDSSNVSVSKLGDDFGVECSYCQVWEDSGLLCNCAVAAFHLLQRFTVHH